MGKDTSVLMLLLLTAVGVVSNLVSLTSYMRIKTIQRLPDTTIINKTITTRSLVRCTMFCSKENSYSLYYIKDTNICHCNHGFDLNADDTAHAVITYGLIDTIFKESNIGGSLETFTRTLKNDCLGWFDDGHTADGIYTILPVGGVSVDTWCDMTNDGWTVFQHREDGSENFYRGWTDYASGFGNRQKEYWLGLENLHLLTAEPSEMYIELGAFSDATPTSAYAFYTQFSVGDSLSEYPITLSGYSGTCQFDGFRYLPNTPIKFTTYDNDNDLNVTGNCAVNYGGSWWFSNCYSCFLNGPYKDGGHLTTYARGIIWYGCWDFYTSLKNTIMKVRRKA